jgi:futalosine hydrolase
MFSKSNIFILFFYFLFFLTIVALKILLVFATSTEADILKRISGIKPMKDDFRFLDLDLTVLITGVGGISTAWSMKQWLCCNPYPDLAINAGIAGSFSDKYVKGDVVLPVSDCFADMAIEEDNRYLTLAEAGLMDPDEFPFKKGLLRAENDYVERTAKILRKVKAITVNTSSGAETTIERLKKKFNPDIETMEGATFFYICAMEKIPFIAVRAISNKVEPRNMKAWDIPLALENLAGEINKIFLMLK